MIGEDGRITEAAPERLGMSVDDARGGGRRPPRGGPDPARSRTAHDVPHSHRSGMRIEPLISLQWFCDMTELARPAIGWSSRGGFHPENPWTGVYLRWLNEIRPWCISRQLWWGHQIPAWYRGDELYVGEEAPEGEGWERDPDVLDTGSRRRCGRSPRWAGLTDLGAARVLPHGCARHRPRHHLPLGRPHGDDAGLEFTGDIL